MKRLTTILAGLALAGIASGQPNPNPTPAQEAKNLFTPLGTPGSFGVLIGTDSDPSKQFIELFTLGKEADNHTYLYELEIPFPNGGDPGLYKWKRIDPLKQPNLDKDQFINLQSGSSLHSIKFTRTVSTGSGRPTGASTHSLRAISRATDHTFHLFDHGANLRYTDN